MQSILNLTAMANRVAPQFLEYAGFQDERNTVGKVLYHFTIMDPSHNRYQSTVAFQIKADTMNEPKKEIEEVGALNGRPFGTGRELSCAVFPNDDQTVTLTVFEKDKSASIDLNEVSLGQLVEILKFHAT